MRIQTYFKINERLVVEDLNMKHKQVDNTETRSPEGNKKNIHYLLSAGKSPSKDFLLRN